MKAWLWDGNPGVQHLRLDEAPDPPAAEGEVVMEVHYAALSQGDRMLLDKVYPYPVYPPPPHVLGRDGVGTIIDVGDGVDDVHVGDRRVILRGDTGLTRWGSLAERVSLPAANLVDIPDGWTEEQASGATLNYLSAYFALTLWEPLTPGSVVLITGASGGVGVAATQLASALGHTVVALSRSEEKQQRLKDIGATFTFDASDENLRAKVKDAVGPHGVNMVIDNLGGRLLLDVIDTLGEQGRVSLIGNLLGPVPEFDTGILFSRRIRVAPMALNYYTVGEKHAAWKEVVAIMARSGARPEVDHVFAFTELPQAFQRLIAGPMGKVVIKIG